ncbi:hypothetical protein [Streptomyces sp. NPDC056632]|uniref:hypothetical protein n=1 Tax=Streptomyces sp. NPDC056632 TaxID=3345884 RepID=UPI0036C6BE7C
MKRPARLRRALGVAATLALALATTWGTAAPAAAHRNGCHRWHSCPSDTGSYVCGDLGYFTYCGYDSLPTDRDSDRGSGAGDSQEYDDKPPGVPTVKNAESGAGGKVTVVVTAERGARIEVRDVDDTVVAKASATGSPQRIAFAAEDGEHTYTVVAVDPAGNSSAPAEGFTVSTDATEPTATALTTAPADPATAAVPVTFTAEAGAAYDIRVEGRGEKPAGTVGPDGAVREDLWLPNGTHRVTVTLRDAVGNTTVLTGRAMVDLASFTPRFVHDPAYRTHRPGLRVTGPRGAKGTLTVAGTRYDLALGPAGTADVPVSLSDGSYTADVSLTDPFGRLGTARSTAFAVDTTPPALTLGYDAERARYGDAVVVLAGERGATAVVETDGSSQRVTLTGARQTLTLGLRPGTHTVGVTVTDRVGNTVRRSVDVRLSDEWTTGEILRLLLWCLGILFVLALVGTLLWRGRRGIIIRYARWREAARVAAEARAERAREETLRKADEAYERDLARWRRERERLVELRDLAVNPSATVRPGTDFRWGRRKAGERVLWVGTGALVEVRTRQGVQFTEPTETGEFVVTDLRVLFQGVGKRREWEYDKWLGHDHAAAASQTLITVTNRKKTSGVAYAPVESERVRLVIDVALARARGERPEAVDRAHRRLADHEQRMPVAPSEV